MTCDSCKKKQATVFLTQIIKGDMQKVNLCESCSKEKGVTDPTGFALADMLLGIGGVHATEAPAAERTCPQCGMSQSVFRKTGRLGCAHCYRQFADGLEQILSAMFNRKIPSHVGKIPAQALVASAGAADKDQMAHLEEALRGAVQGERYEEAARLRDAIKNLAEQASKPLA